MKILVTGSRSITDEKAIFALLDKHVDKTKDVIIHGGAGGVDSIAEGWCKQNDVESIIIRPVFVNRKEYYLYRNTEMIGMCDMCLAFWDGVSRGTRFTFEYAKQRGKEVNVFNF